MKPIQIKSILKSQEPRRVYDIHHNLPPGAFYDRQPNLVTDAALISNCGRHAGGVVLTDSPLEKENMPLIIGGKDTKRSLQTPWTEGVNYRMLEHFGFLKFDFLALGTLRIFEKTVEKVLKKTTGRKHIRFEEIKKWFGDNLSPDRNPMTDINVYKNVFWDGNYMSIFQFVKPNTQSFMRRMKPTCIRDIAIATSIHRPGPLSLKVDEKFLQNRENHDNLKYEHPLLREVLENTENLLIFQEQLQLIYHKLCGIPLDETDGVRKAFTKKEINNKEKAAAERDKLKGEFMRLSKENAGVDEKMSSKFFDNMSALVAYSFNKCLHQDSLVETKEGMKKIKDVVPEVDFVNSQNGFVKVVNKYQNGRKNLVKIKTKSGKELICTLDHKIQTPEGMKTVQEIINLKLPIVIKDTHNTNTDIVVTNIFYQVEDIISTEIFGEDETYDLEVDHPDHTFYANGISVSNSHAVSYSIATYQCAHFLTYHPDEWVTSCLDYNATEKGKVVGQDDPKATSMREAQKLGYKFAKPDINWSGQGYDMHPTEPKVIVPGFTSIKGIGMSALQEIYANRPYKTLEDLLITPNGQWRHSKFNKKALGSLIQLEGFDSLGFVGPNKQVENYKQLYNIILGNYDNLKRISGLKKNNDIRPVLQQLVLEQKGVPDWTREEKIGFWLALAGSVNMDLVLDERYVKVINQYGLVSIDAVPEPEPNMVVKDMVWFIVKSVAAKTSKAGKPYLEMKVNGEKFVDITLRLWNVANAEAIVKHGAIKKNSLMCGEVKRDNFGFSTFYKNIASLLEASNHADRDDSDIPIG
jgi:DNA polymerase III alpha subunit